MNAVVFVGVPSKRWRDMWLERCRYKWRAFFEFGVNCGVNELLRESLRREFRREWLGEFGRDME